MNAYFIASLPRGTKPLAENKKPRDAEASMEFDGSFFDWLETESSSIASLAERTGSKATLVSWMTLPETVPQYKIWLSQEQLVMSSVHHWHDFKMISR